MIDKFFPTDWYFLTRPYIIARTRRHLLRDLGALVPLIAALGGEQALAETARAILNVARWWP